MSSNGMDTCLPTTSIPMKFFLTPTADERPPSEKQYRSEEYPISPPPGAYGKSRAMPPVDLEQRFLFHNVVWYSRLETPAFATTLFHRLRRRVSRPGDVAQKITDGNERHGGVFVRGYQGSVRWNKILVGEKTGAMAMMSRVLIVHGPAPFVTLANILQICNKQPGGIKFYEFAYSEERPGAVELHFASVRGQAQSAEALVRKRIAEENIHGVSVTFGVDPCA
ncbi:hypothetical protein B0T16DRAFT_455787 [Cercophora newfieldiana]|uniref:Uncharacterized protein n=1 Tax=Cercophora newfieldiana TaxID=92897 RepID=A0AA40CTA5_9PEZI|nr:hypothetical protein B0T16DRAFT_455787 [Cercophora newfieldiana]